MTDQELLEAFEGCILPAANWTHEAHVRIAWIYLRRNEAAAALDLIRRGITRYNERVLRKPGAYHETITVAYTRLIAERMAQFPGRVSFGEWSITAARRCFQTWRENDSCLPIAVPCRKRRQGLQARRAPPPNKPMSKSANESAATSASAPAWSC
jgi:hypothetical protein